MKKIISDLSALAGLFHDIGKSTAGFQKKLEDRCSKGVGKNLVGDPIKHDFMGVLILEKWLLSLEENICALDDFKWLDIMSDPDKFAKSMKKVFKKSSLVDEEMLQKYHNNKSEMRIESLLIRSDTQHSEFINSSVRYALLYLVLSHHRMPTNRMRQNESREFIFCSEFVDASSPLVKGRWSKLSAGHKHLWSDPESIWMAAVSSYASAIREGLSDLRESLSASHDAGAGFITAVTHFARSALIHADFQVSSEAAREQTTRWGDSAVGWANTVGNERPGQRLDDHLIRVGNLAPFYLDQFTKYPAVIKRKIGKISTKKVPIRFQWQVDAEELLSDHDHNNGLLVFLMAGTGSGKTICGGRLLNAVSPNGLRFNFVAGLRTLTLQTADSYIKDLGLNDDELATVMGCDVELAIKKAELRSGSNGIHHGLDIETDQVVYRGRGVSKVERKIEIFRDTPIIVSTIDSLIDSVLGTRNTGALSISRLSNSDFIIDEVDSYSESDLVGITKLVYFIGFCGKKVILSSATITPEIAEIMGYSYIKGYRAGLEYRGEQGVVDVAWVSEQSSANQFISNVKEDAFLLFHNGFATKMVEEMSKADPIRKAQIIKIEDCTKISSAFETIEAACINMHKFNQEVCPLTGKSFSFGLVRLSTVESCKEFALYLNDSNRFNDYTVKICCYHSQQMVGYQHCLEDLYNRVLKRNLVDGNPSIFGHEEVSDVLKKSSTKNVIFIMVSSPIEEVGRDHDFDWGIVEPTSLRAVIQTAGRIRRHRGKGKCSVNLGILSVPLLALRYPGVHAYAYPGPESPNLITKDRDIFDWYHPRVECMLDCKSLENKVDARDCILPTDMVKSQLGLRERFVQRIHFFPTEDDPGYKNAKSYIDSPVLKFGGSHHNFFKFRGDNFSYSYIKSFDSSWRMQSNGKDMVGTYSHLVKEIAPISDKWLYVPTDKEVDSRYRNVFSDLSDEDYRKVMYVFSVQVYGDKNKIPNIGYSVQSGGFKIKDVA